jgi:hypothetical protein
MSTAPEPLGGMTLREIVRDQLRHSPNPDPHVIVGYVLPLLARAQSGSGFA